MKRFVEALRDPDQFGSGTRNSPEFNSFVTKTRNDFRKSLGDIAENIQINRGHFDFFGFLTRKSDGQVIYFNISDVRYFPGNSLLVRAADDYKDYTGGWNDYVRIDNDFESNLRSMIINIKG